MAKACKNALWRRRRSQATKINIYYDWTGVKNTFKKSGVHFHLQSLSLCRPSVRRSPQKIRTLIEVNSATALLFLKEILIFEKNAEI